MSGLLLTASRVANRVDVSTPLRTGFSVVVTCVLLDDRDDLRTSAIDKERAAARSMAHPWPARIWSLATSRRRRRRSRVCWASRPVTGGLHQPATERRRFEVRPGHEPTSTWFKRTSPAMQRVQTTGGNAELLTGEPPHRGDLRPAPMPTT